MFSGPSDNKAVGIDKRSGTADSKIGHTEKLNIIIMEPLYQNTLNHRNSIVSKIIIFPNYPEFTPISCYSVLASVILLTKLTKFLYCKTCESEITGIIDFILKQKTVTTDPFS